MKVAIMFSGQGSQYPGMMQDLFENYPCAMESFELAKQVYGRDIYDICMNGTQEKLDETENTQPCLLVCEFAALRVLKELGIPYDAAMGFSLGEWTALSAVGAADEAEILKIVELRAAAMQRAVPLGQGGMASILGKDNEFVAQFCKEIGDVEPAIYNCAGNISVAGKSDAIDRFLQRAEAEEIMASRVAISIPSHCWLMEPAVEELTPLINALELRRSHTAFVMNASGQETGEPEQIKANLIRQLSKPVLFGQSVETLLEQDYDTFIEVGPGKVLSGLVKRAARQMKKKVTICSFNSCESVQAVKELFAKD